MPPQKRRRRDSVNLQKRLKALRFDYLAGKRDLPQFLRAVGHNIRLQ